MNIILGTAQIGLDYGVTNAAGRPTLETCFDLLDSAYTAGVRVLDSAEFYGDANAVIGQYHQSKGHSFRIINKIFRYPIQRAELVVYKEKIIKTLHELSVDSYDTLMVHNSDLLLSNAYYADFLCSLKEEGVARRIGVSIQSPQSLMGILSRISLDVVQLPINLFDQRSLEKGVLAKVKERGVEIHARSIFLQGSLLSNIPMLPNYFRQYQPAFLAHDAFCKTNNLTKLESALLFPLSLPQVDQLVLGCQQSHEFSEIMQSYKKIVPMISKGIDFAHLSQSELGLIDPTLWNA